MVRCHTAMLPTLWLGGGRCSYCMPCCSIAWHRSLSNLFKPQHRGLNFKAISLVWAWGLEHLLFLVAHAKPCLGEKAGHCVQPRTCMSDTESHAPPPCEGGRASLLQARHTDKSCAAPYKLERLSLRNLSCVSLCQPVVSLLAASHTNHSCWLCLTSFGIMQHRWFDGND